MRLLIYDCEISKCIPPVDAWDMDPDLQYCKGWNDFEGMGISVIGAYIEGYSPYLNDWLCNGYKVFVLGDHPMADLEKQAFQELANKANLIVGFNSKSFDDQLCLAEAIAITTDYDLLEEVRIASGQPAQYVKGQSRSGYNLDAIAKASHLGAKTSTGAKAPVLWQRGKYQHVIDYCLNDVALTNAIWANRDRLTDPTNGEMLKLREPKL